MSCWPCWRVCAAGREGLRKVHEGLKPPAPTQAALERGFAASLSTSTASASPARLVSPDSKKYLTAEKMKPLNNFLEQMTFFREVSSFEAQPSAQVLQGQD